MTKKVNIASDFSQKVSELFQSLHGEVKVDIELYEFAVTFLYNPGKFIDSVYVYIDLSSEKLRSDLDFLAQNFSLKNLDGYCITIWIRYILLLLQFGNINMETWRTILLAMKLILKFFE